MPKSITPLKKEKEKIYELIAQGKSFFIIDMYEKQVVDTSIGLLLKDTWDEEFFYYPSWGFVYIEPTFNFSHGAYLFYNKEDFSFWEKLTSLVKKSMVNDDAFGILNAKEVSENVSCDFLDFDKSYIFSYLKQH